MTTETNLFLSYCHRDKFSAAYIVSLLVNELGYKVFWDEHIPNGTSWEDFLAEKIRETKSNDGNFVFLASEYSLSSAYCKREYNYAVRQKAKGSIFLLDPRVSIPEPMGRIQCLTLYESAFTSLQADIKTTLANSTEMDPTKHLLNLPADRSYVKTLNNLEKIVKQIMQQRRQNDMNAGKPDTQLGIQMNTIYEILDDGDELNPHVQAFSKMLNDGKLPEDVEKQSQAVLGRIEGLRAFIKTFPLRDCD